MISSELLESDVAEYANAKHVLEEYINSNGATLDGLASLAFFSGMDVKVGFRDIETE
jgi:hypothetical protein